MVEERQIDGIIDLRGHLPHLPFRWIRMWLAWMVEVHWLEKGGAKLGGWRGLYDLRKSAVLKNYQLYHGVRKKQTREGSRGNIVQWL